MARATHSTTAAPSADFTAKLESDIRDRMEFLREMRQLSSDFADAIYETAERIDLTQGCVHALLLAAKGMKHTEDAAAIVAVLTVMQGELNMIESNAKLLIREAGNR